MTAKPKRNYFADADPAMRQTCLILGKEKDRITFACNKSGVSRATINRWMSGQTRRPYGVTIDFVLKALGYHRPIVKRGVGE
jgi:hypothetical protein